MSKKKVSDRCCVQACEFYKPNLKNACNKFEKRTECPKSMKQRRKSANRSKRNQSENWW